MWCMTQKFFDNGTTTNSQAAGCWSIMHHHTEVPSSQKPRQGQDSHPDCITTTYWVDCSIQGRESHLQSQQGVHHVSAGGLQWTADLGTSTTLCPSQHSGSRGVFFKKKPRSCLLLLGRSPINTTSPPKVLQMLKMHPTPSLTMLLKSFLLSFRTCWTWGGGVGVGGGGGGCQC